MDYQSLLNSAQLLPVKDTQGAVLVLAGAGSGKTRVLTYRIAYLIEHEGVDPRNILAITFTNKAAGEMRERILDVTGRSGMLISTFHSLCAKILRNEISRLGDFNSNFSIYDKEDSKKIVTRILKSKNIDLDENRDIVKRVLRKISEAKCNAMNAEEYARNLKGEPYGKLIIETYEQYEMELKENNALDFDDLLYKTLLLFANDKKVLEKYQDQYKYIHVDEFQDTSRIQYTLVRMLANKYRNIFVVGDDDQSIYGWRGADVLNMSKFTQHYPDCRVYKLEQNYRSTKRILDLANKIIANNSQRMDKTLWTDKDNGVKNIYKSCYDEKVEADYVLEQICNLIRYNNYDYKDFAILVRASSQTRPFEDKLQLYGFPYKIIGGNKFYDRKEIKDFLAYLKFVANPNDTESILRVINVPKRGIGETAVQRLIEACAEKRVTLLQGILDIDNMPLTSVVKNKIRVFSEVVWQLREKSSMPLIDYIDFVNKYVDFACQYNNKDEEDKNRLDNIDGFITLVKEYCKDNPSRKLDEYLQSVSLLTDSDQPIDDCITLATIHGIKGLEYKCCFIVGLEEGLFPSLREGDSDNKVEEERRIMYVAITRARERLYLTNAQSRYKYDHKEYGISSRFLKEGGLIVEPSRSNSSLRNDYFSDEYSQYQPISERSSTDRRDKVAEMKKLMNDYSKTSAFANNTHLTAPQSKDVSIFKVGMAVEHSRFGQGKITSITGENAKVEFPSLGVKMFNLRLAPIKPIED
ncbi:MAG: UvrD-helicase domain-containing protein [Clostridiales bacterium]|nr:UvrD-helicase domain-containing protein [Clostridiales bacterium]